MSSVSALTGMLECSNGWRRANESNALQSVLPLGKVNAVYELHYIANKHRAVTAVEHAVVGLRDVALYLEVFQQSGPSDGRPPLQQHNNTMQYNAIQQYF